MKISTSLKNKLKLGFLLFLFATLLFFSDFIAYIFISNISQSMDLVSWPYYIIAAIGHASLFSFILLLGIYTPLSLIFRTHKIATTIYSVFVILLQTIILVDIFVFDIYKFHINGFVIELILGGAASDIFVFDWMLYFKFSIMILFFAVIPLLTGVFIAKKYYTLIKPRTIKCVSILFISCIILSHLTHTVAHAAKQYSIQKSITALPLFFPLTANSLLLKWGIIDKDQIDSMASGRVCSDIQYPKHEIVTTDSIPNYNIIYILIDSWNPRSLDATISPNIVNFAQRGHTFKNHMSSSNGTRGSVFGVFFGVSFTYEKEFYMSKTSPVIVDQLLDRKYDIEIFPSADFTSPPFHDIIFKRVPGIRTRTKGNSPFERDKDVTTEFVKFIDNRESDKPFFSFLFYDLAHAMVLPANSPKKFETTWDAPKYMELRNDMDPTPFFNLYKNCVYETDIQIGKVLKEIEAKGLLENSVIIITGDHGQEFNENKKNYWGHNGNYSKWQIQIPFIIYYPGIEAGKTYTHTTTHYDISPTVLKNFLGVRNPMTDYSMGYSLWDQTDRYPHLVGDHINYGFVMHNAIITSGHTGQMNVYDLEMNNLSRDKIDLKELNEVIEKKNMFYKK